MNFAITNNTMVEGLTVCWYGETTYDRAANDVANINTEVSCRWIRLCFRSNLIGYQQNYTSGSVSATNTTIGANDVEMFGIAFNVNDALSISYQEYDNTYKKRGDETADGLTQARWYSR